MYGGYFKIFRINKEKLKYKLQIINYNFLNI